MFRDGHYEARGEYVVIRCITDADLISDSGIDLRAVGDVRSASLFEICSVGNSVPSKAVTAKDIGNYCVSLATSLNPVNGMDASEYALVHYDTIGAIINAEAVAQMSDDLQAEKDALRLKANGLPPLGLGLKPGSANT